MQAIFTQHARFEMERREIQEAEVIAIIENPMQKLSTKKGRIIMQGLYFDGIHNKEMLLRVIGKETKPDTFIVITVYKTSKKEKYL